MNVVIRPATKVDIPLLIAISRLVESPTYIAQTTEFGVEFMLDYSVVFIIESDAEPVGFITYRRDSLISAYVEEIAVHPNAQGKGIAREAFEISLVEMIEKGCRRFSLHVHPENYPALKLYKKMRFRESGERVDNFRESGEPRIEMYRRI